MEPPQETEAIATEEQPVGEAPPAHEVTATKQVDETPQPEDSLAEATRAEEPVVEAPTPAKIVQKKSSRRGSRSRRGSVIDHVDVVTARRRGIENKPSALTLICEGGDTEAGVRSNKVS